MSHPEITRFTIFGERCCGTNYLEELMHTNFDLTLTWEYGYKHFFGFFPLKNRLADVTLFLCIVRHPVEWLHSFFNKPHHIPPENLSVDKFFTNRFYSRFKHFGRILENDKHLKTREFYSNIFEMREVKHEFLMETVPKQVKHYLLLRYEDVRDHPQQILQDISQRFQIPLKIPQIQTITYYKKNKKTKFQPKRMDFEKKMVHFLTSRLNHSREKALGYILSSN